MAESSSLTATGSRFASVPLASEMNELTEAVEEMKKRLPKFLELQQSIDRFSNCFGTLQTNLFAMANLMEFPPPPVVHQPATKAKDKANHTNANLLNANAHTPLTRAKARAARASDASVPEDTDDATKRLSSPLSASKGTKKRRRGDEATSISNRKSTRSSTNKKTPLSAVRSSLRTTKSAATATGAAANTNTNAKSSKKRKLTFSCPPSSSEAQSHATTHWKWDKADLVKIPKKYQAKPELKALETILLYLQNTKRPISIAQLVKHSSLRVIKAKEMLQTLMAMNLVERQKEKSGFLYTTKTH